MKTAWLLPLLLMAVVPAAEARALTEAADEIPFNTNSEGSLAMLAADLASLALRMARHSAGINTSHPFARRHRKHRLFRYKNPPAVEAIDSGVALSVPIAFHGHNLTVVTLKNDEFISRTLRETKEPFQKELLGQLLDFISPGSTVVDAGANLGLFSIFFAAQTGPKGSVYSFEPQMRMYQMLCTNAIVNSLMHIRTQNKALSNSPGTLHMSATVQDGSNAGKLYSEVDKAGQFINYGGMRIGSTGEEIQAVTLDSYNLTGVSVIKVDVQGAERLMFYGAQDTIRRNLPVVAFEANEAAMEAQVSQELPMPDAVKNFDVMKFFTSLGYKQPASLNHLEKTTGDKVMLPPQHPYWAKEAQGRRHHRRSRALLT